MNRGGRPTNKNFENLQFERVEKEENGRKKYGSTCLHCKSTIWSTATSRLDIHQ